MHPQADIRSNSYYTAVIRESAESTVVWTDISLNRCNSITSVNGMDGSFSAECQSFVDLVTTHVCRHQKGTKRIKQFKSKVTSVHLYIFYNKLNLFSLECSEFRKRVFK